MANLMQAGRFACRKRCFDPRIGSVRTDAIMPR